MDLGSINEKLLQNVQRAQIEQIALVTKSLGLKIGSQFLAQVQQITQSTPDERTEIIKSIDATLAQLNKNSAAPATRALINQLIEQKKMLQDPAVRLANLNISPQLLTGTATASPHPSVPGLLTYTNQPFQTGETLLLQITDGSRLKILQPLNQAQLETLVRILQAKGIDLSQMADGNNIKAMASALKELAMQIAKFDLNQLLVEHAGTGQLKATTANEAIRTAIGESLRNLLPKKDSGQDLLTNLPKIANFIQHMPMAERKDWLSNQIQDALKTLANHIRFSDQLSNPKLLAMTLKNNGQRFEHKLAQSLQTLQPANGGTTTTQSATAGKINAVINLTANLLHRSRVPDITESTNAPAPIDKMITQDLKGALLGLLHHLDVEVNKISPPLTMDPGKNSLVNALPQFLGLLINKHPTELTQKQLRTQLIQLMHQYTLGSLAKIQLQQIHSINQQLSQTDVTQPNQSWQFDIPVRHGQEVHPLQIQMEQQWIEEQQDAHTKSSHRTRQWNVMLNFDLPVVGKLYAQLGLLGNNLNAKFWAEHEQTLIEAGRKLDSLTQQLEKEGINVTHIQCVPGAPPKSRMSLSYSLVDIKT